MASWKSLINQKELNILRGKFVCVLTKNQLRFDILEKVFEFHMKISIENWFLTEFYTVSFYTALENSIHFLRKFFEFVGRWGVLGGV